MNNIGFFVVIFCYYVLLTRNPLMRYKLERISRRFPPSHHLGRGKEGGNGLTLTSCK